MRRHNAPGDTLFNGLKNTRVSGCLPRPYQREVRRLDAIDTLRVSTMAGCALSSKNNPSCLGSPRVRC